MKKTSFNLRISYSYVLLALCAAAYLYPFMRVLSNNCDEGTLLYGAVRVLEGQVPFRDFFEVMGPGTFYWIAVFFKLFGATWFATRLALMVTAVGTLLLMYFLARRLRSGFGLLPSFILSATLFGGPWSVSHHTTANLFGLLAFTAIVLWLERRRAVLLVAAGILAGLTTCFLQPTGVLLFLSFLLILWLLCRRENGFLLAIALLVGSYFLVAVAVIWFYAQAGGLAQLIYANVIWPITNYGRVNGISYAHGIIFYREDWAAALKSIVSPVVAIGVANFFIVPLVIVAGLPLLLGLFGLRYKNLAFTRVTLPYWVAGFAFWLSEMHRKDIVHLIYGSPLLMILLVHLYRQLPHRIVRRTLEVIAICTVSLLIVNAGVVLSAQNRLTTKRGTLYSFHPSPVLDFLNSHTESGEAIFAYPYCPIYYFLASATNPTRLSILLYHMNTDSQFREAIGTLKRVKVHYVIWDTTFYARAKQALPGLRAPQTEQQIVEAFLMQYYKPLANYDGVQILQRKDKGIYTSSKDQSVRRRTDDES